MVKLIVYKDGRSHRGVTQQVENTRWQADGAVILRYFSVTLRVGWLTAQPGIVFFDPFLSPPSAASNHSSAIATASPPLAFLFALIFDRD